MARGRLSADTLILKDLPRTKISLELCGYCLPNFDWKRPAEVRRPCRARSGRVPPARDQQLADCRDGAARRPRPAGPRSALVPWTSSALLPKRVVGTKTEASAGSDRASLPRCQRVDDRMPALSLGRLPRTLQARRVENLCLLNRRIGTQGPRSDQGPCAQYRGNRHQSCARACDFDSCEAPAQDHPDRHRRLRGVGPQQPDCQAGPHPSGGCPDSPGHARDLRPWAHEIIQLPKP